LLNASAADPVVIESLNGSLVDGITVAATGQSLRDFAGNPITIPIGGTVNQLSLIPNAPERAGSASSMAAGCTAPKMLELILPPAMMLVMMVALKFSPKNCRSVMSLPTCEIPVDFEG
jgi:hypothetical protein